MKKIVLMSLLFAGFASTLNSSEPMSQQYEDAALILKMPDDLQTLGLEYGADFDQIKRAYRQLGLRYHPDKNPEGSSRFKAIAEAYSRLEQLQKRGLLGKAMDAPSEGGVVVPDHGQHDMPGAHGGGIGPAWTWGQPLSAQQAENSLRKLIPGVEQLKDMVRV